MNFSISPKRVFVWMLAISFVLVALHIGSQAIILFLDPSDLVRDILEKWNVDNEVSIATWYAQVILLFAAVVAGTIAAYEWKHGSEYKYHWIGLGLGLVYLSIDEGAALHELLIEPMQALFDIDSGPLFFAWLIPVTLAVFIIGLLYTKFWWNLPKEVRTTVLIAVLVFLGGGVVMEMISGNYWQANEFANNFTYRLFNGIEEGLEYIGVSIGIYALLMYKECKIEK